MSPVTHTLSTHVAWADTDRGGRIHFTAPFRWAEAAETSLLRCYGLLEDFGDYPRRSVQAEYLTVLRFEDEIAVELAVDLIGRTSVEYTWEIRRGEEVCVRGRHTVVHVDGEGRPSPLPEMLRRALAG